jgi:HlyD family secretion protein
VRKRLIVILAVALLLGGGWYIYQTFFAHRAQNLELHGNVDIRQVNLGFRVSGRIQEMRFEEGDVVHTGDVIASLDPGPNQDQVNLAKAQLASAEANFDKLQNGNRAEEIEQARAQLELNKANLTNAELVYKRQSDLAKTSVISKQDYDNAVATRDINRAQVASAGASYGLMRAGFRAEDIAAGRAQVDNARANLENAERNLSDCNLLAPSDGTIITRALEPGAIVAAGTTAYSLCLFSPVWIRAFIDEKNLGRIYPGMRARVYTDTNPGKPYDGVYFADRRIHAEDGRDA